jgi:hypothetical protein
MRCRQIISDVYRSSCYLFYDLGWGEEEGVGGADCDGGGGEMSVMGW